MTYVCTVSRQHKRNAQNCKASIIMIFSSFLKDSTFSLGRKNNRDKRTQFSCCSHLVFKDQTIGHHPQTRAMLDLLDSLQQILVFRLFLITISRQLLIRWSRKEIWLSGCWKKNFCFKGRQALRFYFWLPPRCSVIYGVHHLASVLIISN